MRLTRYDGVATLLFAAILAPYIGYVARGSMPFVQDPEGMAATALILGAVAAYIGGWVARRRLETLAVGTAALGLAILTLVSDSFFDLAVRNGLMAGFMATIVLLWTGALLRHERAGFAGPAGLAPPAAG